MSKDNYPITGRDAEIDLTKYSVTILGREIIDYEKLRLHEPELYDRIVKDERESNRLTNFN